MSNAIIRVRREASKKLQFADGTSIHTTVLELQLLVNDSLIYNTQEHTYNYGSEAEAVQRLIDSVKNICDNVPNLKENVVKMFERLSENKVDEHEFYADGAVDVQLLTPKQVKLLTHVSCCFIHNPKKEFKRPATRYWTSKEGFDQRDLKYRVKGLDESSEAYKFFTHHSCPVCLRDYKQILDDGHHLMVADCGHVYCCSCLDVMIKSEDNQTCAVCKQAFWPQDFIELVLNIDYKPNLDVHGKVFFS